MLKVWNLEFGIWNLGGISWWRNTTWVKTVNKWSTTFVQVGQLYLLPKVGYINTLLVKYFWRRFYTLFWQLIGLYTQVGMVVFSKLNSISSPFSTNPTTSIKLIYRN